MLNANCAMTEKICNGRQKNGRERLGNSLCESLLAIRISRLQCASMLPRRPVGPLRVAEPGAIIGLVQARSQAAFIAHDELSAPLPLFLKLFIHSGVQAPAVNHGKPDFSCHR